MKFTEITQNGKVTINFDGYDKETGGYGATTFYNSPNNCKLGIIEYCDGIFCGNEAQQKARLNHVLSRLHLAVSLNTYRKEVADFLKKNYELYSCAEVPIGYPQYGGIQYHIIIRNTLTKAGNVRYQRPIPKNAPTNPNKLQVVQEFLKKRRRKTDIATELVKLLQEPTAPVVIPEQQMGQAVAL